MDAPAAGWPAQSLPPAARPGVRARLFGRSRPSLRFAGLGAASIPAVVIGIPRKRVEPLLGMG